VADFCIARGPPDLVIFDIDEAQGRRTIDITCISMQRVEAEVDISRGQARVEVRVGAAWLFQHSDMSNSTLD
jgi:hypothetical protein